MPLYAYKCRKCKVEFEKIVSIPNPDISQSCPNCGAESLFFIPQGSRNNVLFHFDYMAPDA